MVNVVANLFNEKNGEKVKGHDTDVVLDESHNSYLDLGSIIGSLDMLEFMVWGLVVRTTNSTGYYIENGIFKRSCEGVDDTRRHLIGYVSGAQHA